MALVSRKPTSRELTATERSEANRVRGCQTPVWLDGETSSGRFHFRAAAEGTLVRGLVFFLCDLASGRTASEIVQDETDPLEGLGLRETLSPTRQQGLDAVRRRIRELAAE